MCDKGEEAEQHTMEEADRSDMERARELAREMRRKVESREKLERSKLAMLPPTASVKKAMIGTPEKGVTSATPEKMATSMTPEKRGTSATPEKRASSATPEKRATNSIIDVVNTAADVVANATQAILRDVDMFRDVAGKSASKGSRRSRSPRRDTSTPRRRSRSPRRESSTSRKKEEKEKRRKKDGLEQRRKKDLVEDDVGEGVRRQLDLDGGAVDVIGTVQPIDETIRNVGFIQRPKCLLVVSSSAKEDDT